jgi:prevent-host-death family protein
MAKTVNIHAAKTHLSRLIDRAAAGEEIIIARAGKPVARLAPLAPAARAKRKPGLWRGMVKIADDFDAPLPEGLLKGFYEEPVEPPAPPKRK